MEKSKTVHVVELHGKAEDLQRTLSTLKKDFEGITIPSELNKAFAKLEHSISSVLRKTEKGVISREDFHDTEKELSKIKTAFDNLTGSIEEVNKASDKKLMSMLPEDTVAKIEQAKKAYDSYSKTLGGVIAAEDALIIAQEKKRQAEDKAQSAVNSERAYKGKVTLAEQELAKYKEITDALKEQVEATKALADAQEALESARTAGMGEKALSKRQEKVNEASVRKTAADTKVGGFSKEQLLAQKDAADKARLATEKFNAAQKASEAAIKSKIQAEVVAQTATNNLANAKNKSTEEAKKEAEALENLRNALAAVNPEYANLAVEGDSAREKLINLKTIVEGLSEEELVKLKNQLNKANKSFKNTQPALDNIKKSLQQVKDQVKETDEVLAKKQAFEEKIKQFLGLSGAAQVLHSSLRDAMETIKELDATMTEMSVVTDLTVGDYWDQLPEYSKQASDLGVSINSAYKAATLYYQQGLKNNEVTKISAETLKMAKIANLSAEDATNKMTAALRGFNMELNETSAQRVSDVYSELAAITASDVKEISTAMTKTASIAASAGMKFETTAAFLSQIIETTRESAETAGTAMKTVIARFQELKKAPNEIGEIDGEIVDANAIEKALRSVGVSLRDSAGQFRELDEVFLELSSKWDTLDKNTQRYIATIAAGSRQQSRFIAMMSNYARTQELVTAANNSAGASNKQFEKTMDSLQSKIEKLGNAWHEFTMSIMDSDLVKFGVDVLTKFLEIINKATTGIGGLGDSLTKIVSILAIFKMGKKIYETFKPLIDQTMSEWITLFEGGGYRSGKAWAKGFNDALMEDMPEGAKPEGAKPEGAKPTKKDSKEEEPTSSIKYNKKTGRYHKVKGGQFVSDEEAQKILEQERIEGIKRKAASDTGYDKITSGRKKLEAISNKRKELTEAKKKNDEFQARVGALKKGEKNPTLRKEAKEAEKNLKKVQKEFKETQEAGADAWNEIAQGATKAGVSISSVGVGLSLMGGVIESIGMEKFGKVVSGVGQAVTLLGTAVTGLATVLSKIPAILTMISQHPIVAIVVVVLAVILGTIMAINAAIEASSPETKLKKAEEAAARAGEAADDAANSYKNLADSLNGLSDEYKTLDDLTKGTKEWNEAVIALNNQVLDLIEKYPELANFVSNEGGVLTLDVNSDEVQSILSKEQRNAQALQNASYLANAKVAQAQAGADFGNLEAVDKVGTHRGWEAVGAGAAVGSAVGGKAGQTAGWFAGTATTGVGGFLGALAGRVVGSVAGAIPGLIVGSIAAPFAAAETKLDEELQKNVEALANAIGNNEITSDYESMLTYLTDELGVAKDEAKILAKTFSEDTSALREYGASLKTAEAQQEAAFSAIATSAKTLINAGKFSQDQMDQMGMVVGSDLVGGYVDTASNNYEEMNKKELTAAKEEYAKSFGADAKVDGNKIIYTDAEGEQQERVFENEEEWISAMSAADVTDQVAKAMEQVPEMLARSSSALEGVKSGAGEAYEKAMSQDGGLTKSEISTLTEIDNAALQKAWDSLTEEQKKIYEGDFLKYTKAFSSALNKNQEAFEAADKSAEKLGITLNGNLSAKMAENWTKHLEKLSLGEVDTTSLNKALNGMLEGLSVEQTELLMAQLNNVDFSNIESWDQFEKTINKLELPVKDLDSFVALAKETSKAVRDINFETLNNQLQDTYQLIEKIQGNGSRTFSEEEYNELISSNSDLVASFRKIGNDFVYIGGSMDTLTSALQENAIATIQAANKQLDFLITAGTLIGENVGETGAVSDMDTNQLKAYLAETTGMLKEEGLDLSMFGQVGLTNDTDISAVTDIDTLKQWAQAIQSSVTSLDFNKNERAKATSEASILTYVQENTATQNAQFASLGGEQANEHAQALLTQAAMSGGVSEGLIETYQQALTAANAEGASEDDKKRAAELGEIIAERVDELVAENESRETYQSLVDRIADALYDSRQEEIDKLDEINSSVNNAQHNLVNKIQEQINEERQRRNNEKTEKNLGDLQQKKAFLAMQTGGNPLDMLQLDENIATAEQEYQDTLVDQALQRLTDSNEKAAEQRERQIELLERQLDAEKDRGTIANEAAEIAKTSIADIQSGVAPLETAMGKILWQSEGGGLSGLAKETWVSQLNQTATVAEKYLTGENKKKKQGITFGGITLNPFAPTPEDEEGGGAGSGSVDLTNPDADSVLSEWQQIQNMFSKFFNEDIPNWWNQNLAQYFTGDFWSGMWSNITQWWGSSVTPMFNAEYWGNLFAPVKAWWDQTVAPFFTSDYWTNLFAPVSEWWNTTIMPIFDRAFWDELFSPVAGWWDETIAPMFSAEYWNALWQQVVGWWQTNVAPIFTAQFWSDLWANIVQWYNDEVAQVFTLEFWSEKFYAAGVAVGHFILDVQAMLQQLAATIGNVWTEISAWWTGTVVPWWDSTIGPILTKEFWVQKGEAIVQGLVSTWESIVSFFTVSIPNWWNTCIKPYLTLEFWVAQGQKVLEGLKQVWGSIRDFFLVAIPQWWNDTFGKYLTLEFWEEKWKSLTEAVGAVLNGIGTAVATAFGAIAYIGKEAWDGLVQAAIKAFETIVSWIDTYISPIFTKEFWQEKWENIKTTFRNAIEAFEQTMDNFEAGLMSLLTSIYNVIMNVSNAISTGVKAAVDAIVDWFKTSILPMFTKQYWVDKWNNFTDALKSAWESVKSWWDTDIKPMFTAEYWEQVWEDIKKSVSDMAEDIKETVLQVFDTIKQWWDDNIAQLFTTEYWEELWKSVTTSVDNFLKNIDETLTNAFKTVAGSVVDAFEAAINAAIKGINGAIESIANIYNSTLGSFFEGIWSVVAPDEDPPLINYTPIPEVDFDPPEYKTGGLADFTGPAWLDGTPSKPEYVLNAAQTEKFFALIDVLEGLDTKQASEKSNGDNYFDISINVDKIESDYDVEQMANKIRSIIYEDASYRNVNAVNLLR